eukprot:m.188768 g.188768  ORF g.188768 m.188768 type:complete len:73 (+) comp32358_c0_seq9:1946-2164(+)
MWLSDLGSLGYLDGENGRNWKLPSNHCRCASELPTLKTPICVLRYNEQWSQVVAVVVVLLCECDLGVIWCDY